ncbi:MAG: class I tRNA ligase family protein, partial [Sideroxyarcus sp.]|nr:class I tRNA ligase family protein [Sideroxyarcus sp.]
DAWKAFLRLLAPLAPHIAHELFSRTGEDVADISGWPKADEKKLKQDTVVIIVQVNGKLRARMTVPKGAKQNMVEREALMDEKISAYLARGTVKKIIFVQDRLLNFVVQ